MTSNDPFSPAGTCLCGFAQGVLRRKGTHCSGRHPSCRRKPSRWDGTGARESARSHVQFDGCLCPIAQTVGTGWGIFKLGKFSIVELESLARAGRVRQSTRRQPTPGRTRTVAASSVTSDIGGAGWIVAGSHRKAMLERALLVAVSEA